MASFEIFPLDRYEGSSAAIRRPKEIASFSYDEKHVYHPDRRSLRYYYPPRLGADLSAGFEQFRKLDESVDDHLDSLLARIAALERETGQPCEADIITWRGMMTKIMSTPYDQYGGAFEMNATYYQGTIFIEENHAYKLRAKEPKNHPHHQRIRHNAHTQEMMSYWGYKFESLCLLPDTWDATSRQYIESRESEPVDNYAQYCSIVKTGIGDSRLVLGGEVDAVWDDIPDEPNAPIKWVELKTALNPRSKHDMLKYERKLLKFWVQSFLLGVPKIIVGFRSQDGILQRLESLDTQSIPNSVKRNQKTWDGNVCINFTAAVLAWLKATIVGEGVWRIRRKDHASQIEAFKVEGWGHGDILSREFLEWRTKQQQDGAGT